jgi:3'(2'), 5'-bisphosphate nucleotidase
VTIDRAHVLAKLLDAANAAAEVVMRIYRESDVGVEMKAPDDPVTRADREANALLVDRLSRDFPGVPIVAEESAPPEFEQASAAFFVDPVDGTREFIAKNGEFAIMLGLAEEGNATVGVVDCPALGEVFAAAKGIGAFRIAGGSRHPIRVSSADIAHCRCAVSRSRRDATVQEKLARIGAAELIPLGSAGIKAARLATGEIDLYAHPSGARVKLWDACAPDAIVREAGGIFTDTEGASFDYRGPLAQGNGTLAANPALHAEALRRLRGDR